MALEQDPELPWIPYLGMQDDSNEPLEVSVFGRKFNVAPLTSRELDIVGPSPGIGNIHEALSAGQKDAADALQDLWDDPTQILPWAGALKEADELYLLIEAAKVYRDAEPGTPEYDRAAEVVGEFLMESQRGTTWGHDFTELLKQLPAFVGEFGVGRALAKGVLGTGRRGLVKFIREVAEEAAQKNARKGILSTAVKGTGKYLKEELPQAALTLAGMEAFPQFAKILGKHGGRTDASIYRRMLDPTTRFDYDEMGQMEIVMDGTMRSYLEAAPFGVGDMLIETLSEGFGSSRAMLAGKRALRRIPPLVKIKALQHQMVGDLMKKKRISGFLDGSRRMLKEGGWDGMWEEWLEERFGANVRTLTMVGEDEWILQYDDGKEVSINWERLVPDLHQWSVEAAGFSVPGASVVGADLFLNRTNYSAKRKMDEILSYGGEYVPHSVEVGVQLPDAPAFEEENGRPPFNEIELLEWVETKYQEEVKALEGAAEESALDELSEREAEDERRMEGGEAEAPQEAEEAPDEEPLTQEDVDAEAEERKWREEEAQEQWAAAAAELEDYMEVNYPDEERRDAEVIEELAEQDEALRDLAAESGAYPGIRHELVESEDVVPEVQTAMDKARATMEQHEADRVEAEGGQARTARVRAVEAPSQRHGDMAGRAAGRYDVDVQFIETGWEEEDGTFTPSGMIGGAHVSTDAEGRSTILLNQALMATGGAEEMGGTILHEVWHSRWKAAPEALREFLAWARDLNPELVEGLEKKVRERYSAQGLTEEQLEDEMGAHLVERLAAVRLLLNVRDDRKMLTDLAFGHRSTLESIMDGFKTIIGLFGGKARTSYQQKLSRLQTIINGIDPSGESLSDADAAKLAIAFDHVLEQATLGMHKAKEEAAEEAELGDDEDLKEEAQRIIGKDQPETAEELARIVWGGNKQKRSIQPRDWVALADWAPFVHPSITKEVENRINATTGYYDQTKTFIAPWDLTEEQLDRYIDFAMGGFEGELTLDDVEDPAPAATKEEYEAGLFETPAQELIDNLETRIKEIEGREGFPRPAKGGRGSDKNLIESVRARIEELQKRLPAERTEEDSGPLHPRGEPRTPTGLGDKSDGELYVERQRIEREIREIPPETEEERGERERKETVIDDRVASGKLPKYKGDMEKAELRDRRPPRLKEAISLLEAEERARADSGVPASIRLRRYRAENDDLYRAGNNKVRLLSGSRATDPQNTVGQLAETISLLDDAQAGDLGGLVTKDAADHARALSKLLLTTARNSLSSLNFALLQDALGKYQTRRQAERAGEEAAERIASGEKEEGDTRALVSGLDAELERHRETKPWVYIVTCGQAKRGSQSKASEMYTSSTFTLSKRLAKKRGDFWMILSAEHGLLDPDQLIDPYNETLKKGKALTKALKDPKSRESQIAKSAGEQAWARYGPDVNYVILGPRHYVQVFRRGLNLAREEANGRRQEGEGRIGGNHPVIYGLGGNADRTQTPLEGKTIITTNKWLKSELDGLRPGAKKKAAKKKAAKKTYRKRGPGANPWRVGGRHYEAAYEAGRIDVIDWIRASGIRLNPWHFPTLWREYKETKGVRYAGEQLKGALFSAGSGKPNPPTGDRGRKMYGGIAHDELAELMGEKADWSVLVYGLDTTAADSSEYQSVEEILLAAWQAPGSILPHDAQAEAAEEAYQGHEGLKLEQWIFHAQALLDRVAAVPGRRAELTEEEEEGYTDALAYAFDNPEALELSKAQKVEAKLQDLKREMRSRDDPAIRAASREADPAGEVAKLSDTVDPDAGVTRLRTRKTGQAVWTGDEVVEESVEIEGTRPGEGLEEDPEAQVGMFDEHDGLFEDEAEERDKGIKPAADDPPFALRPEPGVIRGRLPAEMPTLPGTVDTPAPVVIEGYHGSRERVKGDFDPKRIGSASGDTGYLGRGFYFYLNDDAAEDWIIGGEKKITKRVLRLERPLDFDKLRATRVNYPVVEKSRPNWRQQYREEHEPEFRAADERHHEVLRERLREIDRRQGTQVWTEEAIEAKVNESPEDLELRLNQVFGSKYRPIMKPDYDATLTEFDSLYEAAKYTYGRAFSKHASDPFNQKYGGNMGDGARHAAVSAVLREHGFDGVIARGTGNRRDPFPRTEIMVRTPEQIDPVQVQTPTMFALRSEHASNPARGPWVSKAARILGSKGLPKRFANVEQLEAMLRKKGVKDSELKLLAFDVEFGDRKGLPLTEIRGVVDMKGLLLEEVHNYFGIVELASPSFWIGGGYLREDGEPDDRRSVAIRMGEERHGVIRDVGALEHGDYANMLGWVRYDTRVVDGEEVMFIHELQSDWYQKGARIGFEVGPNGEDYDLGRHGWRFDEMRDGTWVAYNTKAGKYLATPARDAVPAGMFAASGKRFGTRLRAETAVRSSLTPRGPWSTNDAWRRRLLDRMVFEAASRGHTKLAWATGATVVDLWAPHVGWHQGGFDSVIIDKGALPSSSAASRRAAGRSTGVRTGPPPTKRAKRNIELLFMEGTLAKGRMEFDQAWVTANAIDGPKGRIQYSLEEIVGAEAAQRIKAGETDVRGAFMGVGTAFHYDKGLVKSAKELKLKHRIGVVDSTERTYSEREAPMESMDLESVVQEEARYLEPQVLPAHIVDIPAHIAQDRLDNGVVNMALRPDRDEVMQETLYRRFTIPRETLKDHFAVRIQDYFRRVRRVQEIVAAEGGADALTYEEIDTYLAEEQFSGRVMELHRMQRVKYIDPLKKILGELDLTGEQEELKANPKLVRDEIKGRAAREGWKHWEYLRELSRAKFDKYQDNLNELGWYVYALHAHERNAEMARRYPALWGSAGNPGSGMSDAEAEEIIGRVEAFDTARRHAFEESARLIFLMNNEALDRRVEAGLTSAVLAEHWRDIYPHYVPLRSDMYGDEDPAGRKVIAGGYDIRGEDLRQARGRRSLADNPVIFSLVQYQTTIVRAEKNRVTRTFLEFVRANPDETQWVVVKANRGSKDEWQRQPVSADLVDDIRKKAAEEGWGQDKLQEALAQLPAITTAEAASEGRRDRQDIAVKENGVEYHIKVTDQALVTAMKRLGQLDTPRWVQQFIGGPTRFLARMNTAWDPEFILRNLVRDLQTAGINLQEFSPDAQGNFTTAVLRDTGKAINGTFWAVHQEDRRGVGREWSAIFDDFRRAGGKTSMWTTDDYRAAQKKIIKGAKAADPSAPQRALNAAKGFVDFVEHLNEAVENGIRVSVFHHARTSKEDGGLGLSTARAASLAKNITVNFNRKGSWGGLINAAYMFANAGIQGNARLWRGLKRSKRIRRLATASFVLGFWMDQFNRWTCGEDDDGIPLWDKVPEYEKNRSLMFCVPGLEEPARFPAMYGFNLFVTAGRQASAMRTRDWGGANKSVGEAAKDLFIATVDNFNPLGSGTLLQTLAPTLADPIAMSVENKRWTGAPLRPGQDPYGQYDLPRNQLHWANVHPAAKWGADAWNSLWGGDEFTPGRDPIFGLNLSLSPEDLEEWWDFASGGLGRTASRTWHAIVDDAAQPEDIPFLRIFYGGRPERMTSELFYHARSQLAVMGDSLDAAWDKDEAKAARIEKRYAAMLDLLPEIEYFDKEIAASRKDQRDQAAELTTQESAAYDAEQDALKKEFLRMYFDATEGNLRWRYET